MVVQPIGTMDPMKAYNNVEVNFTNLTQLNLLN
jgi:hypothetical protein